MLRPSACSRDEEDCARSKYAATSRIQILQNGDEHDAAHVQVEGSRQDAKCERRAHDHAGRGWQARSAIPLPQRRAPQHDARARAATLTFAKAWLSSPV
jgi:hypothetical protein